MADHTALHVAYRGQVDVDVIAEQEHEEKARRAAHRKMLKAFHTFLASSQIFATCGEDFTLLIYLLRVLGGEITQEHIDRAQALRGDASLKFPLLPRDKKREYLRIELVQPPSAVLAAMLERDNFRKVTDPKGKLSLYYGEACLADYKLLIAAPNAVLPCDIAPETVDAQSAPVGLADIPQSGAPRDKVEGGADPSGDPPRMRIDKLHDTAQLRDDYRQILATRGRATREEIGEDLALKYGLKRLQTATLDKIEATLKTMASAGELVLDLDGRFRVRAEEDTLPSSERAERSEKSSPQPPNTTDGTADHTLQAPASEDAGQSAGPETHGRDAAPDPNAVGMAA